MYAHPQIKRPLKLESNIGLSGSDGISNLKGLYISRFRRMPRWSTVRSSNRGALKTGIKYCSYRVPCQFPILKVLIFLDVGVRHAGQPLNPHIKWPSILESDIRFVYGSNSIPNRKRSLYVSMSMYATLVKN